MIAKAGAVAADRTERAKRVRSAMSDAARLGMVSRNVAADAEPPRAAHQEIEALTPAQVRRLVKRTADNPDGPLYVLAVYSGLRQGELLGLTSSRPRRVAIHGLAALARSVSGAPTIGETKTARSRRTIHSHPSRSRRSTEQRRRQDVARAAAGDDWQDQVGLMFTDALGRPLRHDGVSARFRPPPMRSDTVSGSTTSDIRTHPPHSRPGSRCTSSRGRSVIPVSARRSTSTVTSTTRIRQTAADAIARAFGEEE